MEVPITDALGQQHVVDSNQSVVVHAVDAQGNYLGLLPEGEVTFRARSAPPPGDWLYLEGAWRRAPSLIESKNAAITAIDAAAGAARMKYITDVPGQAGTYIIKAQQAKDFIAAGGLGPVPPYIQVEADATGLSTLGAAEFINSIAVLWSDQVGPGIEYQRRAATIAVEAASTHQEVATALANGLEEMQQF